MPESPKKHDDTDGEVSETSGMEEAGAGEEVMPDQAVAGAPDADGGEVEEGTAGPNARPRDNTPGKRDSDEN